MHEQDVIYVNKPQINISFSSTGRMWLVCGCAFLCVLQSALNDGGQTLVVVFTAFFTALLTEFLLTWREYRAEKIKDGSAAVTAMVLSLLLPNQIHPVYVAFGTVFAVTVVKYSFGGLGANWLNPALGGWLFMRFSWPGAFKNAIDSDSTAAIGVTALSSLDNSVTGFLNSYVFSIVGVQLPSGYIDLLFNSDSSIIADRGLLFLLIGTILITAAGINRGWIPLVFLAVYGFLVRLAGDLSGVYWNGDIIYGIFSGGTIAAAFILAAEPSSSVKSTYGVLFTVVLGAVFSWFFRYRVMEFQGCFIALAMVNCVSPLVRLFEEKFILSRSNREKFQEKN